MKTGRPVTSPRSAQPYRLLAVLMDAGIQMGDLRKRLRYARGPHTGKALAASTMTELVRGRRWPQSLDPEAIKTATAEFLREHGVAEDRIACAWHIEGELAEGDAIDRQPTPGPSRARDADSNPDTFHAPEPEMLSQRAREHFKIPRPPFVDDVQGPEDLYLSTDQRYVRQSMYEAARHGGLIAIAGESGSGKSTLRRDMIDRIGRDGEPIIVIQPKTVDKTKLNAQHICEAVIADLSNERPKLSLEAKARQVERLLANSTRIGNRHVLVIEEAHDLTDSALKYLKRFWEMEDGYRRMLAIALVGQPELLDRLDERRNYGLREFIRRCEVAVLRPLDNNLEDYIAHKFKRLGLNADDLIERGTYDAIRTRLVRRNTAKNTVESQCYPLIVQNTLVRCLNAAAELGLPRVTPDLVARV